MKKIISILSIFVVAAALLSAQVLPKQGVENTLSVSMGEPYDSVDNNDRDKFKFYGLIDTLQIRVDISKFTIEGMLNWGALTYGEGVCFANTEITPYYFTNYWRAGSFLTNGNADSYYVNFIWRPAKNFEVGMGTRLNWVIGPAPSYGGMLWEPATHVVQGGLKDGVPGNADVVGYVYYANCYARTALAARYKNDLLEAGVAIPSGATTSDFRSNVAFGIQPFDWFYAGAAVEIAFGNDTDLYTGIELTVNKNFIVDAYFALDNIGGAKDNMIFGTGASVDFRLSKIALRLKPEVGFTFYENTDYTFAFYVGVRGEFEINSFLFGLWTSSAWGASDKNWPDKYSGGFVSDIRPDITYQINKNHSVSAMFDFQYTSSYDKRNFNTWATSVYWTYKL